jgi:phospholipid/cholesterol/gamma-HCH transport system substrate-binding protein
MPRTRSLSWAELRIGLVTIVGFVITAIAIFLLTGDRGFFWQRYQLKTMFENVAGLRPGSPVRVAGYDVGTVTQMEFVGEQVEVTFEVHESMGRQISTASRATLGSVSLLGESAVDITPSAEGEPIPEWGYVPSSPARGQLADVAEQATQGIESLTALIEDMRTGRGTVGRLMTDDALYEEIRGFAAAARELAAGVQEGQGTLGQLANDPQIAQSLEATLKNAQTLSARLEAGEGSMGKLLTDDGFYDSLEGTVTGVDAIVDRMNQGQGSLGKLLTDDTVANQLASVTQRLDQMTASLNAGEGTAGRLLKDRELYENMNTTVRELQMLIADIREDPRRYLNVRVSIF